MYSGNFLERAKPACCQAIIPLSRSDTFVYPRRTSSFAAIAAMRLLFPDIKALSGVP